MCLKDPFGYSTENGLEGAREEVISYAGRNRYGLGLEWFLWSGKAWVDLKSVLDIEPLVSTIIKRLERQPCIVVKSVGSEIGP